ncbi:hypothetical protein Scep_014810 [Stephania cephalantha]|uniref:1-acylglycerol-3-phosphate O-acyltransferase n=1 Tax=Stephania cephalantha TaxID=152367 RepID=A0AAP0P0U5_9MAGN
MSIAAAAVVVPLGFLFFLSGLIVNLAQAICFVVIRPLSKNTYRKINRVLVELLWLELIWLIDWWAHVKVQLYTDSETFNLMGKEHALLICNHRSDIDWLVGWVLAQRAGCLGSALALMKKSSKFLPRNPSLFKIGMCSAHSPDHIAFFQELLVMAMSVHLGDSLFNNDLVAHVLPSPFFITYPTKLAAIVSLSFEQLHEQYNIFFLGCTDLVVRFDKVLPSALDKHLFPLLGASLAGLGVPHWRFSAWCQDCIVHVADRLACFSIVVPPFLVGTKVIGWSMWFSEYVFLERSWVKDESILKAAFQRLKSFPHPFWLALFVEGTRFTQAKLLAAQEYAASTGLPIPRNVLIPRTKGFVTAVSNIRSFVPAIYDVTVVVPKDQPPPTMLRIMKGQPSVVHVHIKRHSMKELPETDDGVAQWCRDVFIAKACTMGLLFDDLLDKHLADGTFDEQLQDTGCPKKSFLVVISWSCLLIYGALKFFQRSSLLSSWKGIAFSAASLAIVTILMHTLILFSQSERSMPAKVNVGRPKDGGMSSETSKDKQQ